MFESKYLKSQASYEKDVKAFPVDFKISFTWITLNFNRQCPLKPLGFV